MAVTPDYFVNEVIPRYPSLAQGELERHLCELSLSTFLRSAWRYIDPSPLSWGWHLDAMAEHLEAVARGQIQKLIINVPPRSSKSSMVSVAFQPWVWAQENRGPLSGPQVQFLTTSYAHQLSMRDAVKARNLIASPWYQSHWGNYFNLSPDQNTKSRFSNNFGGYRLATSQDGANTGEGGNIIIIDDPHSAGVGLSDANRRAALDFWDTVLISRRNNPKTDAFICVMQRLHEDDLTGHILDKAEEGEWTHLMLPMRFEEDRKCMTYLDWSPSGEPTQVWEDPRVVEGQLLMPDRMGTPEVQALETTMGPWASSGQLQQRPSPKGGAIFRRDWWQVWGNPEDEDDPAFRRYPACDYVVASFDTAYGEKQNEKEDYSACSVWGVFSGRSSPITPEILDRQGNKITSGSLREYIEGPKAILMDAWQDRLQLHELVLRGLETCRRMKVDRVLIEAKASGLSVAQEFRRLMMKDRDTFHVTLVNPGAYDKVARAHMVSHLWEQGLVYAPFKGNMPRAWAGKLIDNMASFPRVPHDDLTDSAVQALKHLRDNGFMNRVDEMESDIIEDLRHKPILGPIYPTARAS